MDYSLLVLVSKLCQAIFVLVNDLLHLLDCAAVFQMLVMILLTVLFRRLFHYRFQRLYLVSEVVYLLISMLLYCLQLLLLLKYLLRVQAKLFFFLKDALFKLLVLRIQALHDCLVARELFEGLLNA